MNEDGELLDSGVTEAGAPCGHDTVTRRRNLAHDRILARALQPDGVGEIGRAHVAAAKAGLEGFTRALAVEFAPSGITANCVAPGRIGGKRSKTSGHGVSLPGGASPLVGQEGTPADVAEVIMTLCGPAGGFVTGQTFHVNGGLYLA